MVTTLISVRGDAELEVDPDSVTVTVTIPAHSESTAARALPNVSRTVAKLTDELVGLGGRVRAAGQDRAPLSWTQSQINCVPEVSHNQRKGRYENTGRFTARTSIPVEVRQFELLERLIRCLGALELAFSSPQWTWTRITRGGEPCVGTLFGPPTSRLGTLPTLWGRGWRQWSTSPTRGCWAGVGQLSRRCR